jgi:hypothetical protein
VTTEQPKPPADPFAPPPRVNPRIWYRPPPVVKTQGEWIERIRGDFAKPKEGDKGKPR